MPINPKRKRSNPLFFVCQKREKHNEIGMRNEIIRIVKRMWKLHIRKTKYYVFRLSGGLRPPSRGGAPFGRAPLLVCRFFFFLVWVFRPLAPLVLALPAYAARSAHSRRSFRLASLPSRLCRRSSRSGRLAVSAARLAALYRAALGVVCRRACPVRSAHCVRSALN